MVLSALNHQFLHGSICYPQVEELLFKIQKCKMISYLIGIGHDKQVIISYQFRLIKHCASPQCVNNRTLWSKASLKMTCKYMHCTPPCVCADPERTAHVRSYLFHSVCQRHYTRHKKANKILKMSCPEKGGRGSSVL